MRGNVSANGHRMFALSPKIKIVASGLGENKTVAR